MSDKIKEIYHKYKHLDELLSDKQFITENLINQITYDLWQIIKEYATTAICNECNGDGEISERCYEGLITCQKCKGCGRVKDE